MPEISHGFRHFLFIRLNLQEEKITKVNPQQKLSTRLNAVIFITHHSSFITHPLALQTLNFELPPPLSLKITCFATRKT